MTQEAPVTYVVTEATETGMVVRFSSKGEPDVYWGCRLPRDGEAIEDVVREYDPRPYWADLKVPRVVPEVGLTGTI